MKKTHEWYARRYVERYGFAIVPAEPASKIPHGNDWGKRAIVDADTAEQYYAEHPEWNMGLSLGMSGMCSLDIDCEESFQIIMTEFGIDPKNLDDVPTIKGGPNGRRLLFRLPEGEALDYHKLAWPSREDPDGSKHRDMMRQAAEAKRDGDSAREAALREQAKPFARYAVLEIRVGDNRFDVLPPSIHPDTGNPYRWEVQPPKDKESWPTPPDWLMAMWKAWDSFKPQLEASCPWMAAPEAPTRVRAKPDKKRQDGVSVIDEFVAAHDLVAMLEQYGYKRKGKSRYLSPHSSTGLPGVTVFPGSQSCWIHHASDPLCSEENGQPVNAFDLFRCYEHSGDMTKAVKHAAELLGLKPERRNTPVAQEMMRTAEKAPGDSSEPQPEEPPVELKPSENTHRGPFQPLGYNDGTYYFLPSGTEQVASVRKGSITSPAELMALAPLEWWESVYPKSKGGADWPAAANHLIRQCEARGIYSEEIERGRGAWFDEGRPVLHLGSHLLVDGQRVSISDHRSKYIYTRQTPMETDQSAVPANDDLAQEFVNMFRQLNWASPVHALYAAGFCALAPICGGLKWRPHLWLTARRGAGKSWIQDHLIGPMIGPGALMVQGNTTEAGIRQALRQDARPIVFDEAESEDLGAQKRMQAVIELARRASSDSTAQVIKGTADGSGLVFRARSMFLLGSINVALSQAADESRFTVVTINPHEESKEEIERFNQFSKEVDRVFTDENCAAIRSRVFRAMPIVRKNAAMFARAVAEKLGSQRIGDQIGALIAGWHILTVVSEVSLESARSIIHDMDFSEAEEAKEASDEESCLNLILQSQIRFSTRDGMRERSVGELVEVASGREYMDGFTPVDANDVLGRYGLSVDGTRLCVSNQHPELAKILAGTPWAAGWRRILSRIDGAHAGDQPRRFAGVLSRHMRIPII